MIYHNSNGIKSKVFATMHYVTVKNEFTASKYQSNNMNPTQVSLRTLDNIETD